jgi:hypothetical protein
MYVIHPGNPTPVHLTYTAASFGANPSVAGVLGGPGIDKDVRSGDPNPQGGTDSIVAYNGNFYVATSNPTDNTQPVLGLLTVNEQAGTAAVTAALLGNAAATPLNPKDPNASATALNIGDPDSTAVVPASVPTVGGALLLVGEGDRQLAFTSTPGQAGGVKFLSVGSSLGDIVFPSQAAGTLYITDTDRNAIYAVSSSNWPVGAAIAASPIKDNQAQAGGFVATLDLTTGNETPLISGMQSPAGLLFVAGVAAAASPAATAAAVPGLPSAGVGLGARPMPGISRLGALGAGLVVLAVLVAFVERRLRRRAVKG